MHTAGGLTDSELGAIKQMGIQMGIQMSINHASTPWTLMMDIDDDDDDVRRRRSLGINIVIEITKNGRVSLRPRRRYAEVTDYGLRDYGRVA